MLGSVVHVQENLLVSGIWRQLDRAQEGKSVGGDAIFVLRERGIV